MWSGATKRDFGKLQLTRSRATRLALGSTQRSIVNNMHVNLSWINMEEKLTSLLVFVRVIDMLNAPSCLFELLVHSLDTNAYPTRHATRGLITVPSPEQTMGGAEYYIEP
jgi:hypothetical protein